MRNAHGSRQLAKGGCCLLTFGAGNAKHCDGKLARTLLGWNSGARASNDSWRNRIQANFHSFSEMKITHNNNLQ